MILIERFFHIDANSDVIEHPCPIYTEQSFSMQNIKLYCVDIVMFMPWI